MKSATFICLVLCYLTVNRRPMVLAMVGQQGSGSYSTSALHGENSWMQKLTDWLTPLPNSDSLQALGKNAYGQPGLSILQWISKDTATEIAVGEYDDDRIVLKCTKDQRIRNADEFILQRIEKAAKKLDSPLASGSQWVSRKKYEFWKHDFHCTIVSEKGIMNLYQYIVKRQQNERHRVMRNVFYQLIRAVAFLHFAGVTHNDIKPENIRVYIDKHRTLQITLVNYALALPIQLKRPSNSIVLMAPPGGTVGYDSPESIVFGNTNLVQRDTWAVGMTAYTCFMGMPLYGYVSIDRETHQMPSRDYQKQLINLYKDHIGKDTVPPIDDAAWDGFEAIGISAIELLTVNPKYRPTLQQVIDANPSALV